MKLGSTLSPKFFDTYRHLPPGIRAKARESYRLFVADPESVRVLGVLANDIVIWFWIGSHDNYERLIRELR